MSLAVTTDVFCDGVADGVNCPNWTPGETGARSSGKLARAKAAMRGWRHLDGFDLCPACARAYFLRKAWSEAK